MAEKDTVKAIIRAIKDSGGYAIKHHGSAFSEAGAVDICAVYRGYAIMIEAKDVGKKPTKLQRSRLRKWRKAGALAIWCDHIEPAKELLREIDRVMETYSSPALAGRTLTAAAIALAENGKNK